MSPQVTYLDGKPVADVPRRKPVDPKRYNGEGCPWEDYLLKFELMADWNRWDKGKHAEALLMSLNGDAARDAFLRAFPDGMMRCMVMAANPRTLAECKENMTQLDAVLSQEDLEVFLQQAKEKLPAKVRMAKQGNQGQEN